MWPASCCAVGSWGGQRPSLAPYVTVTGLKDGATAAGGRSCYLSSRRSPESFLFEVAFSAVGRHLKARVSVALLGDLFERTVKPHCCVLLRQFARCRGRGVELFSRHRPGRIRARGDLAPNNVDVTAQIVELVRER